MACVKVFIIILIIFILTPAQSLSNVDKIQAHFQDLKNQNENLGQNNQRQLFQLLTQSVSEEAIQELCPFPGYQGSYCVGVSGQPDAQAYIGRRTAQSVKTSKIPPNNSRFQMICVGCLPIVVEVPNGKIFKCNCPSF
ncbi:hypothetical protein ABPG74_004867 [Tetrahymena malaccensis]